MVNLIDDPELKKQFAAEFMELNGRPFILQTDALTAWCILSHLQLALRHPDNTGPTAQTAREVAEQIIATLTEPGTALRQVAEMGWDARYDS